MHVLLPLSKICWPAVPLGTAVWSFRATSSFARLNTYMATQVIPQLQAVDQVKHLSEAKPSFARVGYNDQCEAAINEQVRRLCASHACGLQQ